MTVLNNWMYRSQKEAFPSLSSRWWLPALAILASQMLNERLCAQDISLHSSTMHDQNVFDVYVPFSDQVTNFQVEASKDWDNDQTTFGLSYDGSLQLFHDLTSRNYHVHVISCNIDHHFHGSENFEGDLDPSEEDSSDESDSSSSVPSGSPSVTIETRSDSLDHFFSASLRVGSQFDQQEFAQYDNSIITGVILFRQPLGMNVSSRPTYVLSYHSYPNLAGISNVQNSFGLTIGISALPGGWISFTPSYAIKSYPSSTTLTYTIETPSGGSGGGHGKGSGNANVARTRTRSLDLTTPSVKQFSAILLWKQQVGKDIEVLAHLSRFSNPSTEARVVPQQLLGGIEERGLTGQFTSQNEIFDDHFSYSSNEAGLNIRLSLPHGFSVMVSGDFHDKRYTAPAMDLTDSVALASNRIDRRTEVGIALSKSFNIGEGKKLKPELEFQYLRNNSNAPYYDFDKNVFKAGLEFTF